MNKEDKKILMILMIPAAMFVFLLFLLFCLIPTSVDCYKIVSIGGCDKAGCCRVMLENGEARFAAYPAIGLTSCKTGHRWIWEEKP